MSQGIEVGLGLGSNIGDTVGHLRRAGALLRQRGIVTDLAMSPLYRTAPWGNTEQDWFVNACAVGRTTLAPAALLAAVKALEVEIGRTATARWGPRIIDIDILYLGDLAIESPALVLPHRELRNRAFVLVPLADLRPDLVLGGRRIADLAAAIDSTGVVRMAAATGDDAPPPPA